MLTLITCRIPAHALLYSQGLIEFRAEGDTRSHGDHQVCADCDPDLRLHGVFAQPVEGLHAKVLLDSFEEELDLPAYLVDLRNDQRVDRDIRKSCGSELSFSG